MQTGNFSLIDNCQNCFMEIYYGFKSSLNPLVTEYIYPSQNHLKFWGSESFWDLSFAETLYLYFIIPHCNAIIQIFITDTYHFENYTYFSLGMEPDVLVTILWTKCLTQNSFLNEKYVQPEVLLGRKLFLTPNISLRPKVLEILTFGAKCFNSQLLWNWKFYRIKNSFGTGFFLDTTHFDSRYFLHDRTGLWH